MSFAKTFVQLREWVRSVRKQHPQLSTDQAFSYWFCQASLLNPDDSASILESITGAPNDKGVDVLAVSSASREVYVCQIKERQQLGAKAESEKDVLALADFGRLLAEPKNKRDFMLQFAGANPSVRTRLDLAWHKVREEDYRPVLFYVTTGRVLPKHLETAEIRASDHGATFLAYSGNDCCRIFENFRSFVPSIPFLAFDVAPARLLRLPPEERGLKVDSAILPVRAQMLADLVDQHGERLFARNIRLYKGERLTVNHEIGLTLDASPHEFFHLNNGVTMIGTKIEQREGQLRVFNPQIINGQQTTRTISLARGRGAGAEVLVRVICTEPDSDRELADFRSFVYRIVRSTNSQTAVKLSDLASNNPEQIELERALRRLEWRYVRRSGQEFQASYWVGAKKPYGSIGLKELATALVACLHDPQFVRREGIERLFHNSNDELYKDLYDFTKHRAEHHLFAYLVFSLAANKEGFVRELDQALENYGIYFIAYALHRELKPLLQSRVRPGLLVLLGARSFKHRYCKSLLDLRRTFLRSWIEFFRARAEDEEQVGSFVTRAAKRAAWLKYLSSRANSSLRAKVPPLVERLRDEATAAM